MLNYNMQSLAFSPIPEQNPIEAYGNMLHSDGFISVSGINRRKICRSVLGTGLKNCNDSIYRVVTTFI